MQFLDFEKPIAEIKEQIKTLEDSGDKTTKALSLLKRLIAKKSSLMRTTYSKLSDWQIIQLARHPERPYFLDLLNKVFTDFQEMHGDRAFADDKAVVGGLAKLNNKTVMVIGQEKGRKTKDKIHHNFGMMHPEGYRKALRLMKTAEKFKIPIITFIDTPGAYPGIKAEERGQSEAIARNLYEMSRIKVPIICIVIGEGCSGGALGIGVGDKLIMPQYSYFATISPEGCASILWKTADKASDAAEIMGITAVKLKKLNIVDEVIEEPLGGFHHDIDDGAKRINKVLSSSLDELESLTADERNELRYKKIMSFGVFSE